MNSFSWLKVLGIILSLGLIIFGLVYEIIDTEILVLYLIIFTLPGLIFLYLIVFLPKIKFNKAKQGYTMHIKVLNDIFFVNTINGNVKYKGTLFNMKEIVKYQLVKDEQILFSSGIGEAIVGGILFGGTGAVAGAYLGKKIKVKNKCILFIETNNILYAGITIPVDEESGFKICKLFELYIKNLKTDK